MAAMTVAARGVAVQGHLAGARAGPAWRPGSTAPAASPAPTARAARSERIPDGERADGLPDTGRPGCDPALGMGHVPGRHGNSAYRQAHIFLRRSAEIVDRARQRRRARSRSHPRALPSQHRDSLSRQGPRQILEPHGRDGSASGCRLQRAGRGRDASSWLGSKRYIRAALIGESATGETLFRRLGP